MIVWIGDEQVVHVARMSIAAYARDPRSLRVSPLAAVLEALTALAASRQIFVTLRAASAELTALAASQHLKPTVAASRQIEQTQQASSC